MIRAVFFDIDGTLISHHDLHIPASVMQALDALHCRGIKTGIATGRHTLEIEEENLLKDLTFDFYVTLNGQLCYKKDKLVYDHPMACEDVKKMLEISEKYQIPVLLIEAHDMYMNFINDDVIAAQQSIHTAIPPIKAIDIDHLPVIYQMCIYTSPEKIRLLKDLKHTAITQWHDAAYDLISDSGSKTEGIAKVLKDEHITLDEVICFGDGDNDADMLDKCGIGIAMKDASQKALAAADLVTKSVEEDGIYHALKQLKII